MVWNSSNKYCISGILLSTHCHNTIHLKKGTQTWSISTNPTDGQTDDSATPWVCTALCQCSVLCAQAWILQPFLTCWLLQNLTWCTLHPHMLDAGSCRCENGILVIRLQILRTHLINGCKMHCVTWSMILAITSRVQLHCCADTGPGKRLHIVILCGRVICGSPTAVMGKATWKALCEPYH